MKQGDPQERCETVKIKKANGGFSIINASDFDPEIHERFSETNDPIVEIGNITDKREEYEAMNKEALKSLLDAREVAYHPADVKAELVDLLLAKDITDASPTE